MKELHKIGHPLFILSVLLLILNDWYFKASYHNELTGKLSDITGLFALPFFLGAIFPKHKKFVHCLIGILFLLWNSEFSQTLINYFNSLGIPVGRTIDPTDNFALLSIVLSYKCLLLERRYELKPIFQGVLVLISCLAFCATTLPPREQRKFIKIDKEYEFEFSKRELVSRLNMVQLQQVRDMSKVFGPVDFDAETNVFHFPGSTDTLALILDYNKLLEQDTLGFRTSFAEILISGDHTSAKLKLLSTYRIVQLHKKVDYRTKSIKQFEKLIIKKIRKYR